MIRALCFDLDGTLAGYAGGFLSFLALLRQELLLQHTDLVRFAQVMEEELARDGALTLKSALRRALARLEETPPADLERMTSSALLAYAEDVRPAPGAWTLLERLRLRGLPMALVSNGPVDMQRAALAAVGMEGYFRSVLVSGDPDVAARKPAPRIFALACTGLEALPEETLMVGDSASSDVEGALAYGMQAVLVGPAPLDAGLQVPAVGDLAGLDTLLAERYGL